MANNTKESKEIGKKEYTYVDGKRELARSNVLMESKMKTTLFENKVIALALANAEISSQTGAPVSTLPISVIKKQLKINSPHIYSQLRNFADKTTSHKIILDEEIDGEKGFKIFYLINKVVYPPGKGELTLYFDSEITPHITNLKAPYTVLNLDTLSTFKSNATYRIYELLMTKSFLLRKYERTVKYYNLDDLRMKLGLIDVDNSKFEQMLHNRRRKKNQSGVYVKERELEKGMYMEWRDFRRYVLQTAQKELVNSTLSPIIFDFEPVKKGRGARVEGVNFIIQRNPKYIGNKVIDAATIEIKEKEQTQDKIGMIMDAIVEPLTEEEASTFLKDAEGNVDRVLEAYNLASMQPHIQNFVGWMRNAIRQEWSASEKIVKIQGKTYEEAKEFDDFYNTYLEEVKAREEMDTNEKQMVMDFSSETVELKEENMQPKVSKESLESILNKDVLTDEDRRTLQMVAEMLKD